MSDVTNIVLHTNCAEDTPYGANEAGWDAGLAEALTRHCTKRMGDERIQFVPLDPDSCGGTKYLECVLFVAAFNYLNVPAFTAAILDFPWLHPEDVQLWIEEQGESRMRQVIG